MASSLRTFARRMKLRARKFDANVGKLVRQVALAADQQIVTATPVDTGRARANWIVSLNAPVTIERDATDSAQAAISEAEAIIATATATDVIWISNSLPYIEALNNGHSAQAPANFVEQAVSSAVAELKRVKLLED